jgi:hypothetical protein
VPTQQWLLGFEKKQTAAWRLCRVPLLAHRAQLDHFIAQKSKPRNGAREIFMTATAQRVSLVVSAVNTAAVGGRKAA